MFCKSVVYFEVRVREKNSYVVRRLVLCFILLFVILGSLVEIKFCNNLFEVRKVLLVF